LTTKTKVSFSPWKQVVIHHFVQFDTPEKLLMGTFMPTTEPQALQWIDGIVFYFSGFTQTDTIMKDLRNGIIHWDYLAFAPMKTYSRELSSGTATHIVFDVSNDPTYREVGHLLTSKLIKR
jgi:hypothetical protein